MIIDFNEEEIQEIRNCIGQMSGMYGNRKTFESILRKISETQGENHD